MKVMLLTLSITLSFLALRPALAVTCQVLEADGVAASAPNKIDAEKAAWKACISRKIAAREHLRGSVDEDSAIEDAEPCLNAKMKCQ